MTNGLILNVLINLQLCNCFTFYKQFIDYGSFEIFCEANAKLDFNYVFSELRNFYEIFCQILLEN